MNYNPSWRIRVRTGQGAIVYPKIFGRIRLISGINVMRRSARSIAKYRGRRGLKTLEILVPPIPHPTKRTLPTGGVHKPMHRSH